ncbi:MAG: mannose-1-phosphate guanylyltransferase/mannose-6-phosphate isomerase [Lysobacterales bacterium 69-70]|nr:mannose-1-phosphate guanylyltransferase/mannose-6-phosphate isomerase [Xanthomonadaceae bacterium]ODU34617.1 MAG: mannose-1-phosphate guanylyltransferase/mannose-6-phosphate isomerase [Xanthomonadaceae bacterium SCN 69-320]ODV19450.1 MAG: mannose-1-phosphate guanylyltransferase/mannose-6-phosphate isomerase [Xanthomonadaceae bacterium SCN 69-25]OJY94660.1 MAG: mannose-1-phosphate guanylyltransferase/mannose-6-phosphate isomerase [Xanthomonadales bacterium 69-70]
MLIPVILSGGAGTRLWPVSRSAYPKPFMRLADGESLLYKTLDRALAVADDGHVLTVTGRDYYFLTRDEYAAHPRAKLDRLPFLLEPAGRNTAPAILLAAQYAVSHISPEAVLLVLPADHLIRELDRFAADVQRARALAEDGWLATFGIVPTHAETGFGYIRVGASIDGRDGSEVAAFVEKPRREVAEAYLAAGDHLWNSGMFCFRADALLAAAAQTCPDVLAAAQACQAAAMNFESPVEYAREAFLAQPDISIDYAVMEHAPRRAVVPATFDWSDIGSWKAVSELETETDEQGNRVRGQAILIESANCYIQSDKRMVAAVGVHDLVIVDTDDAVLVADKDRAQQVKLVVDRLRAAKHDAAAFHQTVHRPWGSYTVLEDADDCKVKRLVVKPGHVLSLQKHHRRSEHWTVVAGTAKVRVGDNEFLLQANQSTYIPIDTLHRLENPTDEDIHLIEVQCGDYFGEDDIVRLEDRYGRAAQR